MFQLFLKAQLILEIVILTDLVSRNARDFPTTVSKVDKPLGAQLKLAFKLSMIAVRDQICLT